MRRIAIPLIMAVLTVGLMGCVVVTYIPDDYNGYAPASPLPKKASVHFMTYEGNVPLLLARHNYNYYSTDTMQIGFGIITFRTTTTACEKLFAKCIEVRDVEISERIKEEEVEHLFIEAIEIPESTLAERLDTSRENGMDILIEVEVLQYSHTAEEARMKMSWTIYDVGTSRKVFQEEVEGSIPNRMSPRGIAYIKQTIVDNQDICRQLVVGCVERMVKLIKLHYSHGA